MKTPCLFPLSMILGAAFLSPSCGDAEPDAKVKQSEYTISGQVFAIQQNRINVKLGGVQIYYIDGPTFDERISWIASNVNKARAVSDYMDQLDRVDATVRDAKISNLDFSQREFFSSMARFSENAASRVTDSAVITEVDEFNDRALTHYEHGGVLEEFDLDSWVVSVVFSNWLTETNFKTTTTDADGEFKLQIPVASRGYILASSERLVFGSETELYYWIYEVNGEITTPIHLTTSNLLNSQQIGVLIDSLRTATPYSKEDLIADYNLLRLDWLGEIQNRLAQVSSKRGKISLNKQEIAKLKKKIKEIGELTEP